ncbi:Saposin B-type domain-containing protein [Mycena indigotica]|uniref:Saposin B-type domain-containing protein n=1 Tax=Mycena indigotica TaxID=2126181 RepID=A0A8H6W2S7_9AGAR|nr:Saposin B-type domain-containing protein [Mycena indigotica]KAF7303494.1 Saposin B-type domain-containing protein [Mycena indigotica]
MSTDAIPIPRLHGTLGTTEVGAIIGTFLFGIASLQTFLYYYSYPKDPRGLKLVVAIIMTLELVHSVLVWHGVYSITVTFYGQIEHLLNPPHSLSLSILITALILPLVQTFYALRIQALSGSWTITLILTTLTIARLGFSIVLMQIFLTSTGFSVLHTEARWVFTTVASLGPAVDILTAASLCWYLYHMKAGSQPGAPSRRIVDTLIVWTVETTAVTSLAGLFQLIFFLTRDDLTWMTFYLLQPKLFSNSMLASLNNRNNIRDMAGAGGVITLSAQDTRGGVSTIQCLSFLLLLSSGLSSDGGTLSWQGVVIQMRRMTETNIDGDGDNLDGGRVFSKLGDEHSVHPLNEGPDGLRDGGSMRKSRNTD